MKRISPDNIVKRDKIGNGGHWDVYHLNLNIEFEINSDFLDRIVIKEPNKKSSNLDDNIKMYEVIRKAGFKTLNFVEKVQIGEKMVLVVEDLNRSDEIIFVSPNTKSYNPEDRKVLGNSQKALEIKCGQNEQTNSKAESYRKANLLDKIIDFESDLGNFLSHIEQCSQSGIELCIDCFFFSSSLNDNRTKIDYIIADFDNVNLHDSIDKNYIKKLNLSEFIYSYMEFVQKYFKDSKIKEYYIDLFKRKLDDII